MAEHTITIELSADQAETLYSALALARAAALAGAMIKFAEGDRDALICGAGNGDKFDELLSVLDAATSAKQ